MEVVDDTSIHKAQGLTECFHEGKNHLDHMLWPITITLANFETACWIALSIIIL